MFRSCVFTVLTLALFARAAEFNVLVGANNGLTFTPSSISNVQNNDVINFQFQSKNHSATQSTFAAPCTPMTTPMQGADSGFQPVAAGATQVPQFSITVSNASAPLWFFCAQTNPVNHCGSGMVFAVNPTAEKSFDAFQAAAKATAGGGAGAPAGSSSAPGPAASAPAGGAPGGGAPGAPPPSLPPSTSGGASPAGGASGASGVSGAPAATNTNDGMSVRGGAAGVLLAVALGAMLL